MRGVNGLTKSRNRTEWVDRQRLFLMVHSTKPLMCFVLLALRVMIRTAAHDCCAGAAVRSCHSGWWIKKVCCEQKSCSRCREGERVAEEREWCVGGGKEEDWRGGRDLNLAGGHSTDKPAVRSSHSQGVWRLGCAISACGAELDLVLERDSLHSSQPDTDKSRCIEANLKPNLRAGSHWKSRSESGLAT
jgi:hypothetical protein